MSARCIPTATTPLQRFARWLRICSLRWRISDLEAEIDMCLWDGCAEHARFWQQHLDSLRAELRAIESA